MSRRRPIMNGRWHIPVVFCVALLLPLLANSAAAAPGLEVANCDDAVTIFYSPEQPRAGSTIYLNVGVDAMLAYSHRLSGPLAGLLSGEH